MADFWGNGAFTLDNETYLTFTVRDKKKSLAAAKTTTLDHTPPRNGGPGSVGPGSAYGGSYRGSPGYPGAAYGGHSGYGAYSHQPAYMSPPHMSQPPYGHPYMPHLHYGQQAQPQAGPEQMAQLTQLLASMGVVPQPQLTPPPHNPHHRGHTGTGSAIVPSPRGLRVDTTTQDHTSPLGSRGSYHTASHNDTSTTEQASNAAKRSRSGDP